MAVLCGMPTIQHLARCAWLSLRLASFEKMTLCGKIFKISFWKDSPPLRSTSCVQISWNLADRKSVKSCVIYWTKKNKFPLALTSAQITPRMCQGQRQTMYSQCPKFHPNWFTYGGVIAKRVNTIQMCDKVFPILGEATASSSSNEPYLLFLPRCTASPHFGWYSFPIPLRVGGWVGLGVLVKYWGSLSAKDGHPSQLLVATFMPTFRWQYCILYHMKLYGLSN